jgi:serine protease Do
MVRYCVMRVNAMNRKSLGLLLLLLVLGIGQGALAQQQGPFRRGQRDDKAAGFKENPKMLAAFHDVVATPSKSVVRIQCDGKNVALGTIVGSDGWVLTKNSELPKGATPMVMLNDGRSLRAKVVGVEMHYDLAMLKIDATDLTPVEWGKSTGAVVGELLASPGAGSEAVAVGVLSVAARSVKVRDLPVTAPPANSGFLGVLLEEADGGARIIDVVWNSAALRAGLKVGDVVTVIANTPIIDAETMISAIQTFKPGDVVQIKVKRGQKDLEFKATLEKRASTPGAARRDMQNSMGSELSNRRGGFPQILQTDMVLKPSDCGGPVVDLDGKVLGINIARAGRVESYAIPAEAALGLIEELKSGKLAPRAEEVAKAAPTTRPAVAKAATTQPAASGATKSLP